MTRRAVLAHGTVLARGGLWTARLVAVLVVLGGTAWGVLSLVDWATNAREDRARKEAQADCRPTDDPDDTRNLCLYPDRPDRSPDDHEAEVGEAVRLAGFTAGVDDAFMHLLVLGDQLALEVSVHNRSDRARPYGPLDWKVVLEDRVVNPTRNIRDDALGSGELAPGETVTGTLLYELPRGTYDVVFRPDLFNPARGVWRVTVTD